MSKNVLKKIIIIALSALMLFSVVGQFLVSAENNDPEITNNDIELLDEDANIPVNEIPLEEGAETIEITDTDEKEADKKEIDNTKLQKPLDNNIAEINDHEEQKLEDPTVNLIIEDDGLPQVTPYTVQEAEIENSIETYGASQTLDNPEMKTYRYQLVTINNSGKIEHKAYYTSYKSAHAEMKKYSNGALRHKNSHSPMKFIAATRAILQSVPHRVSSSGNSVGNTTMNIYDVNGTSSATYVSRAFEMAYFDTVEYNPNTGLGTVHLGINGFYGSAELKQLDIIPMVYVENSKIVEISGSKEISSSSPLSSPTLNAAPAQSYYKVKILSNGKKQVSYYSENLNRPRANNTKQYWNFAGSVGISDEEWMKDNATYYSWDGVNFYSDRDYINYVGTYYNYYQYMPLRSRTNITTSELNSYLNSVSTNVRDNSVMKNHGNDFIKNGEEYGMNPLLIYSMAAHESGWGLSRIAKSDNNLFGWNAVDSNPSAATEYESVSHSIKEQMAINLRGYLDVTFGNNDFRKDSRYYGAHLGNKGSGLNFKYASDPFWGMKIAGIAYGIDAKNGLKDYKKSSKIGLVKDGNEYIVKRDNVVKTNEKDVATSADAYYNLKSGTGYFKNVTVNIIDHNNTFYKTQSFASIDGKSNIINITSSTKTPPFKYNWEKGEGFIKKSQVYDLHTKNNGGLPKPNGKPSPLISNDIPFKGTWDPDTNVNYKLGDVNGDGKITIGDFALIKSHLLNNRKLKGEEFVRADINKDNAITIGDIAKVKAHLLGNIKLD